MELITLGIDIKNAIEAGFAAGGVDEWDSPEFGAARAASEPISWDFRGWREALNAVECGALGGVDLRAVVVSAPGASGYKEAHDTLDSAMIDAARILGVAVEDMVEVEIGDVSDPVTLCYATEEAAQEDQNTEAAYAVRYYRSGADRR